MTRSMTAIGRRRNSYHPNALICDCTGWSNGCAHVGNSSTQSCVRCETSAIRQASTRHLHEQFHEKYAQHSAVDRIDRARSFHRHIWPQRHVRNVSPNKRNTYLVATEQVQPHLQPTAVSRRYQTHGAARHVPLPGAGATRCESTCGQADCGIAPRCRCALTALEVSQSLCHPRRRATVPCGSAERHTAAGTVTQPRHKRRWTRPRKREPPHGQCLRYRSCPSS